MTSTIPSPLVSAWVVGKSTFLGAIRTRLLLVSLVFALVLIGVSLAAASVSFGERTRLIIDVGLAAGSGLGSLIAIALSVSSFGGEIRNKTAYTILTRPISRWVFILGKFLGLSATMFVVISIMFIATAMLVLLQGEQLPIAFWGCWLLNLVEVSLVVAISLFFSTFAVPALAATYCGGVILAGNLSGDFQQLAQHARDKGLENAKLFQFGYYLLPDLQDLSLRNQAANSMDIPINFIIHGSLYGVSYSIMVIICAMWIFSVRRDL